jgi:hypothetical protein
MGPIRLGVVLFATITAFPPSCDRDETAEPPPPRSGVVLELDRDTARPGQTLELTIENTTRLRFEFGVAYKLERREGTRWRWVNRDSAFILLLKFLEPGDREREEILLTGDLRPGRYRIVKSFTAPAANRTIRATIDFEVI